MLMRNHTPFSMKQHLIKTKFSLKLESSIFKNLWSFSCFKLPPQNLRLDFFVCFKPLTVPELEVYIVYWCQAFLTSRQGTLNKAKVSTYITCSFSLQEEWDRETLGFFLSLLDDRNGNLHFLLLAPRMSSLGCCCWDRTSIGRGRSFFPCSPGQLLSLPGLGLSLLPLAYTWGKLRDVSAQPAELGAVPGRIRCIPGGEWCPVSALCSHRHQSSEQAQGAVGEALCVLWSLPSCFSRVKQEQSEKQYLGLHFKQGVLFILLFSMLWRKLERNDYEVGGREWEGQERMLKHSSAPGTSYFCVHCCPCCPHQWQSSYSHIPPLACRRVCCVSISSGDTWPRLLTFPVLLAWDWQGLSSPSSSPRLLSCAKHI